jgi:site-specific DNA-methyltransferase (adenine-specific)
MAFTIHHGDCREVMATLDAESVDAIVSDPPYGLSFMGKGWDHGVPGVEFWTEALRVAKPGAHLLAFGGTRTYHRLACAIEDAGWEIRDCVMWVYGSGFPKSHDVSKAIDKAAGAEREVVGPSRANVRSDLKYGGNDPSHNHGRLGAVTHPPITAPATDAARQWQGWGTALKPAWEPIIVARKPLVGTVAENVLTHGTGGINVDGCRVGTETLTYIAGETGGEGGKCGARKRASAARFFYCAKASKADRGGDNKHPTVKPTDLMRYLCRLVTPPGGVVLDPFTGSGSTGKAATLEGFRFIGIEREAEYVQIAKARIAAVDAGAGPLFA